MVQDVRQYITARGTRGATLAPDGQLAYRGDVTGTMQVWTLNEPRGWPEQLSFYNERVSFVSWAPDGDAIAFGKDAGANEHDQLFRVDPDDKTITQLTDCPEAIHAWGGWSPDGDRIAFASNRRSSEHFDIYVMEPDGEDATMVTTGDGRSRVVGWSEDGKKLLTWKAHASTDIDLSVIDIKSGSQQHVTTTATARYTSPTFGPDDDAIYCTSDANSDTKEVVRIDLDSHEITTVVDGGDWSIDGFELNASSGRFVYTRNVDGYSELYAGQLETPTEATSTEVAVPSDVVSELTIGPNGEQAAMTVSGTDLNYSVFTVNMDRLDAGEPPEPERWTVPSSGGVPLKEYHTPNLIRYETFDRREIPAYFTLPEEYKSGETPVIVDIHGGPHAQRRPSWRNRPIRQYILDQGYALFEPNVRGSAGYGREYAALDDIKKRMDSVRDAAEGVAWLKTRPEIDSDRVVCWGRSYGGFMVLACITEYPDLWAAAVEFVGISNWVSFLENTGDYRRSHREAEYGSLAENREFLKSISPIYDVDQIQCPLFIQHGKNDPRVPVEESSQIAEALTERNIPVETCILEDEGHHTTKLENRIEQFERVADFLDEYA